jgi:hypothetical protein
MVTFSGLDVGPHGELAPSFVLCISLGDATAALRSYATGSLNSQLEGEFRAESSAPLAETPTPEFSASPRMRCGPVNEDIAQNIDEGLGAIGHESVDTPTVQLA